MDGVTSRCVNFKANLPHGNLAVGGNGKSSGKLCGATSSKPMMRGWRRVWSVDGECPQQVSRKEALNYVMPLGLATCCGRGTARGPEKWATGELTERDGGRQ